MNLLVGEERSLFKSQLLNARNTVWTAKPPLVKLKNQRTHQLILGKPDFNRNFLYAQAIPLLNQLEM